MLNVQIYDKTQVSSCTCCKCYVVVARTRVTGISNMASQTVRVTSEMTAPPEVKMVFLEAKNLVSAL